MAPNSVRHMLVGLFNSLCLDRIHLDSLGSIEYYRNLATKLGFKEIRVEDLSSNLATHYGRVLQELSAQRQTLIRVCTEEYLANMKMGL